MMTTQEQGYVKEQGYVPEHVVRYVAAISEGEPFLFQNFVVYARKDHLIFVGYPLKEVFEEGTMGKALKEAIKRFKPREVVVTAPAIPSFVADPKTLTYDQYYRLDLSCLAISQKVRNMLNRARRDLAVSRHRTFGEDHRQLVNDFLKTHPVEGETRFIFDRIDRYMGSSETAWIFEAREKGDRLVAFDIADFEPNHFAIYMFNFNSEVLPIPGASDLLLFEVIQKAQGDGKRYINLGLGIHRGITFFKKKWGGIPFLPHAFALYQPGRKENLDALLQKL
jgi:hypothetical protein